jgi:predicted O-linked N-acetylglucosamine transferase (SPINDLY family)
VKRPVPDSAGLAAAEAADRYIAQGDRAEAEGRLRDACACYRRAVEAAPAYGKAWLNFGVALEATGDWDGALGAYEQALRIDPENPHANYNLGKLAYMRGTLARAAELLRRALRYKAHFPEAQVVLASVYEAQGALDAAAAALEKALELRPDWPGALLNYGTLLQKLDRSSDAERALLRAAELDPAGTDAWLLMGNAFAEQERLDDAMRCYRRASEIDDQLPEVHHNLGNALARSGRWDEALACYHRAVALDRDFADACIGIGNALKQKSRTHEAIEWYRRALALKPDSAEAHCNLGAALRDEDRFPDYLQHFERALALSPDSADVRWLHALCQIPAVYEREDDPASLRQAFARKLEELDAWFDSSRLAAGVRAVGNQQPFYLAYQEENNRALIRRHGELCIRIMNDWFHKQGFPALRSPDADETIRVGIVSRHFHDHPVWRAIVRGWVQQLDKDRFSVYGFYIGAQSDAETRIAASCTTRFEQGDRGLRQWVSSILGYRPHVLLYPEVGMDALTLKLASLRLAPVQAAAWGHPDTTGLATVDYYLSAEDLEPPEAQQHYTERLLLLPRLGCCFAREQVKAVVPDLERFGVSRDAPLLLCPGTPFKYAPQNDRVLVEIARRLGRCTLVFFSYNVANMSARLRGRLDAGFSDAGLRMQDHVVFVPWQSRPEFYGWLQRADVFLDTIGFSGFNTAMQAIDCGTPIVAREGRFLRGRLASGILKRMGLGELVARSEEDYIALAVRLASDAEFRAQVRSRIEAVRPVVFEDSRPIRALEDFLAEASARQ